MKKYFMLALFATVVHGISIAQTNEELTVLKTCLTQHDYNSKRKEFLTSVGEKVNIKQIDLTTLNSIFTALIWTSVGDDSDYNSSATHDITLYTLRKKNEQYEVLSETTVSVGAPITEVTVATEIISLTGTEALTVRFGRDVDIEGGEIKLNLLSVSPNGSKLILEHVVRINSGEDCESEDLESEVYIMEEATDGYFNINIIDNITFSSSCDVDREEDCTKKYTYRYTWNGREYTSGN